MTNLLKNQVEAVKLWCQALESEEYLQGVNTLQENDNSFCCLGVACLVAEKNGVHVIRDEFGIIKGNNLATQAAVMDWLGLRDPSGAYSYTDINIPSLTSLNDREVSFKKISKIIQSNPEGLFIS